MQEPRTRIRRPVGHMSIVIMAVAPVGKVTGDNRHTANVKIDRPLPDLVESCGEIAIGRGLDPLLVTVPATVVVSCEQHLPAVEHTHERKGLVDTSHRKVAEHYHFVVPRDRDVPTLDERFVHLLGVTEGSAAVVDDVGMAEVQIGREVASHGTRIAARLMVCARDSVLTTDSPS